MSRRESGPALAMTSSGSDLPPLGARVVGGLGLKNSRKSQAAKDMMRVVLKRVQIVEDIRLGTGLVLRMLRLGVSGGRSGTLGCTRHVP